MSVTIDRGDIIRMAREAELIYWMPNSTFSYDVWWMDAGEPGDELERFAALIAAHVRETEFKPDWNNYQQGVKDGAAAEREACVELCVKLAVGGGFAADCAEVIRARGETSSRGKA